MRNKKREREIEEGRKDFVVIKKAGISNLLKNANFRNSLLNLKVFP